MKTILDDIVANRRNEVLIQKQRISPLVLRSKIEGSNLCNSLSRKLLSPGSSGIIAEFKRKSPSKGAINHGARPDAVTEGYVDAGASGLSVLTEGHYFGGSTDDFTAARIANPLTPLLRKDFIVDEYQIFESRLLRADIILLIAGVLGKAEISRFTSIAHELGMEVLLELHDESEIDKIDDSIDIFGINNRNLRDFKIDMDRSLKMLGRLPANNVKISESGLNDPGTVDLLRGHGFNGFLIGEEFMKSENPAYSCRRFISGLKHVLH
jgi:indole-3-glycerol phosphate synthase